MIILDTNIVSYVMNKHPLADVYRVHISGRRTAVSFITVGELYFGAEKARWGKPRRDYLEMVLKDFTLIGVDAEIARCYGEVRAERERSGRPISPHDAWIAACAVSLDIPLLTHNSRDFRGITGLTVISESRHNLR